MLPTWVQLCAAFNEEFHVSLDLYSYQALPCFHLSFILVCERYGPEGPLPVIPKSQMRQLAERLYALESLRLRDLKNRLAQLHLEHQWAEVPFADRLSLLQRDLDEIMMELCRSTSKRLLAAQYSIHEGLSTPSMEWAAQQLGRTCAYHAMNETGMPQASSMPLSALSASDSLTTELDTGALLPFPATTSPLSLSASASADELTSAFAAAAAAEQPGPASPPASRPLEKTLSGMVTVESDTRNDSHVCSTCASRHGVNLDKCHFCARCCKNPRCSVKSHRRQQNA